MDASSAEDSQAFLSEPDFGDDLLALGKKMDALVVSDEGDEGTFGGPVTIAAHMNARPPLKPFAAVKREAHALFTEHANQRLASPAADAEGYAGLADYLTAKGRARMKAKKLELKVTKEETKAAQKQREYDRKKQKNAAAAYSALNTGEEAEEAEEADVDTLVDMHDRVVAEQEKGAYSMAMGDYYTANASTPSETPENPETYDGIMDLLSAKGRARRKERQLEIAAATRETKAKQAREELARKTKKNAERGYTAAAPTPDASAAPKVPALQAYGTHARREQLRMKAIADQSKPKQKTYSALTVAERNLAAFATRVIRHAPGQSLASVEETFGAANASAGERHYYGSLALGAAVAKLRASVEAASGFSGTKLKTLTDDIHAQATVPADADESIVFAQALGDYAADVRTRVQQFSKVPKEQEEEAVRVGERFADVLMKKSAIAEQQAFDTNHPAVVATAVADRLFQATYHSAVPHRAFATERVNSFWAAKLTPKTWRATALDHFA